MVMGPARSETPAPPLQPAVAAKASAFVAPRPVEARVSEARVSDARVIKADLLEAEPIEAEPAPARPASDPLAPIMALSAEEKIALFS